MNTSDFEAAIRAVVDHCWPGLVAQELTKLTGGLATACAQLADGSFSRVTKTPKKDFRTYTGVKANGIKELLKSGYKDKKIAELMNCSVSYVQKTRRFVNRQPKITNVRAVLDRQDLLNKSIDTSTPYQDAWAKAGSKLAASRLMGLPDKTYRDRLNKEMKNA